MRKFFDYLKTKQFWINLGIAFGSVIVLVIIVFYCLDFYTRHGSGIPVPQLIGQQIDQATKQLDQQGFHYQIDSVYIGDKAPGTIVQQDPDAGTNVKEDRTIYLTVITRSAPPIALPDLTESSYREAIATISNLGLKMGDTTYKSDIARDRILEVHFAGQELKPGSKIPKGSKIDLVLGDGKGASLVDIPELLNLDLDEAKFAVKHSGLVLGQPIYQGTITDSTKAIVVSQYPMRADSASKVSIGTKIIITLSQKN